MQTRIVSKRNVNRQTANTRHVRRGNITILTAICLMLMVALVAFAVDIGYLAQTKGQLQNASDASALAAGLELLDGLGPDSDSISEQAAENGRLAAIEVAGVNRAAGLDSVYVGGRDVEFGRRTWVDGFSADSWGAGPYNLVRVTVHRDRVETMNNDGFIPLFFARVLSEQSVGLSVEAKVVVSAAGGYQIDPDDSTATADVLPIAYDLTSWNLFLAGANGSDNYCWNPVTGAVTSGADGLKEIDLYPYGAGTLPPGNRGTVDLGSPNNSTADLKRQIVNGLNADDLSYFEDNTLRTDMEPLTLNGDTGISAGIKDSLESIVGQTRAIPIFSAVVSPGNNAVYTITKFVGVRIMYVELTGGNKKLVAQPTPVFDSTAIPTASGSAFDYVFLPPRLTQ